MAFLKACVRVARIHYLAAHNPYLPLAAASLYIAAPWGATLVQLYFLLRVSIQVCFDRVVDGVPNALPSLPWCYGTISVHAGLTKGSDVHFLRCNCEWP